MVMQQRYCSPVCRDKAKKKARHEAYLRDKKAGRTRKKKTTDGSIGRMITCEFCGKQVVASNSNSTRFCDAKCREAYLAKKRAEAEAALLAHEEAKRRMDAKEKLAQRLHVSYGMLQVLAYREACAAARREAKG